jgi:hypothetical protein
LWVRWWAARGGVGGVPVPLVVGVVFLEVGAEGPVGVLAGDLVLFAVGRDDADVM